MHLVTVLRRSARALRADEGFSMVVTMGVIMMLTLSTAVTMTAVGGDQAPGRSDQQRKGAFAAAEAGLQVYVHKLLVDNNYWDKCTVPNDGVYQYWDRKARPTSDTRTNWKLLNAPTVSETDPTTLNTGKLAPVGAYAIETLPANGATACNPSKPEDTVIDKTTATFRVRVSGRAVNPATNLPSGPTRTLIATFKRKSFLDYIYFTDYEVMDPATYKSNSPTLNRDTRENPGRNPNGATQRNVVAWGNDACSYYSYERGENNAFREDQQFIGNRSRSSGVLLDSGSNAGTWADHTVECSEIRFVTGDAVLGPMHTNDSPLLCGQPDFGRKPSDAVETSAPGTGTIASSYRQDPACGTSSPDVNYENQPVRDANKGTWRYNQPLLQLPASNKSLKEEAAADYTFRGETTIVMSASGLNITGRRADGVVYNNTRVAYPTEGVLFVDNRIDKAQGPLCDGGYRVDAPYEARTGCGIAKVSGEYNSSLTIGAADDVIIMNHTKRAASSPALLGLIAQNFIRVYHPVTNQATCNSSPSSAVNGPGSVTDMRIDAALLTLAHSFIVDNYRCGASLEDLNVFGAISQKFRGPVGTGSRGSSTTGYLKKYEYDDRLAVRSPPKFLDPVQSAWRIKTFQEQSPAQDPPK
ncbi:MAG: hypothetical protein Q7T55_24855 [Solirubrobacteraceae bacterium]|nr:hypothetical protein [Solirubrobacteraceae bacterium]